MSAENDDDKNSKGDKDGGDRPETKHADPLPETWGAPSGTKHVSVPIEHEFTVAVPVEANLHDALEEFLSRGP